MSTNDNNVVPLFAKKPEFDWESTCTQLTCNCGSDLLVAYRQDGYSYLKCAACYTDQTETYFGN